MRTSTVAEWRVVLAGDWRIGDKAYYIGKAGTFSDGDRLEFGWCGEVVGPSDVGDGADAQRVQVKLNHNKGAVNCLLTSLSKEAPVLAGGWRIGDTAYYTGTLETFSDGDRLEFGWCGEVVGPSDVGDGADAQRVQVKLNHNKGVVHCWVATLSKEAPVFTGGWRIGDKAYYIGKSGTFSDGDRLEFGWCGEVVGPSDVGDGADAQRVQVKLNHNKGVVHCWLATLSKEAPVLAGGWRIGDKAHYIGKSGTFSDGDRLEFGWCGEVVGPSDLGDGTDAHRVQVKLNHNKGVVHCWLTSLSKEAPVHADGLRIGGESWYIGRPETCSDRNRLDFVADKWVIAPLHSVARSSSITTNSVVNVRALPSLLLVVE